jgi:hypothetical protein
MNRGYVKVWRKIQGNGILKNHRYCAFFLWSLTKASHKQINLIVGCQPVLLEPGQFVFGRRMAADELGMSEQEIRTCIELAKKADFLTIKSTNKFSIITIINWHIYQGSDIDDQPAEQPTSNQQVTTNKNVKKKNIKPFSSDSVEVRLSALLLEKILSRNLDHKKPNLQTWAKDVDRMIRIDHRTPQDIRALIEWCQADPFWQNNILSVAKLRAQFDQLRLKMKANGKQAAPASSPTPLICPRCGRSLVARSYLIGAGCTECQRALEARA